MLRVHRAALVHVVRDIVEVEEVAEVVAAYTKLGLRCVRVGHRSEKAALESGKGFLLLDTEATAASEPRVGLDADLLAVGVTAKFECTMRDKVWNDNLAGRRARCSGGRRWCRHYNELHVEEERKRREAELGMWEGDVERVQQTTTSFYALKRPRGEY